VKNCYSWQSLRKRFELSGLKWPKVFVVDRDRFDPMIVFWRNEEVPGIEKQFRAATSDWRRGANVDEERIRRF